MLVFAAVAADVLLIRQLERKYDGFGRSPESQESLRQFETRRAGPHVRR
jgi:hypothetical protein